MIARANRLDNGELVEGYVTQSIIPNKLDDGWHLTDCWYILSVNTKDKLTVRIDPSNLKYSFDGVNFYSEREWVEIEAMAMAYEELMRNYK